MERIDKIVFGDNQFFGINHRSQEKAEELSQHFSHLENILKVYDDAFKGRKEIIMKTDNDDLFCFSVESFSKYGYIIEEMCIDLHKSDIENIKTEYEEKFSEKGFTIKYVKVIKD